MSSFGFIENAWLLKVGYNMGERSLSKSWNDHGKVAGLPMNDKLSLTLWLGEMFV